MNNLLPSTILMHEKYDMKGSTYKRKASKKERSKKSPTLKVIIFAFPAQFRAQTHGTFKFFFNAIFYGAAEAVNVR